MQSEAHYRVSVKALVKDDQERLLLVRQSNNKWELLGGGLDHGEEPHEGLKREIFEEAGLEATAISENPRYFITMYNSQHTLHYANVIYDVELKSLSFTPSDECEELRFVTLDEARELDAHTNVHKLIALLEQS